MSRPPTRTCLACGAPIVLVRVQATQPRAGGMRWLPLEPEPYDPTCGVPPSHARSNDWTRCRPLARGEDPAPAEKPALTHFATCPLRQRATPEGTDL